EHIGHPRVDARECVHLGLGSHERDVKPGLRRSRLAAFDDLPLKTQGEQIRFCDQSETDPGGHEKKGGIDNAGADMTAAFDEFLLRQNSASADHVFFKLGDWVHCTPW